MPSSMRDCAIIRISPRVILYALTAALFIVTPIPAALARASREGKSESGEINFTILHTNDEHSALIPHSPAIDYDPQNPEEPTIGGFARLATALEDIRAQKAKENEPVLLFNAGDFMGGTAFGWLAPAGYGVELSLMQAMGYDAAIIGNHEYDYGPQVLTNYLLAAGYPQAHQKTVVLASNTRPPKEHPLVERDLLRDTAIFELDNGIKVGTFGLLGEEAEALASDTGEIEFLDPYQTAQEMVDILQGEGAEIIVAITHSGIDEDLELARSVTGIHVIVGGHSHTALYEPVMEGDTIIVQTGSLGRYLGRLELAYHRETKALRVRNGDSDRPFLIPIDRSISPHLEISLLVDAYKERLNDLLWEMSDGRFEDILETVARSSFHLPNYPPLQESPAGNLIVDGMRLITQQVTGERVDVAIQANGNIRGSIIRGSGPRSADNISFYDIISTTGLGYGLDGYAGYPIVSVYLTGEELRRVLEVAVLLTELLGDTFFIQYSGLRYSYNPDNAVLFTIPIINQPLPTTRAVTKAELYVGEGIQPREDDGQYVPLKRGDERLYHLVTDSYILSFLPMVGDMLPQLRIVPKNAAGEAVLLEDLDQLIVHRSEGRELKVWYTVVEYAAAQPKGEDGLPHMPQYYADTAGRINRVRSFPLIAAVYLLPVFVVVGIAAVIRLKRRR
jgi:5'-nucleotidase / UDP-sugar diphosphatase